MQPLKRAHSPEEYLPNKRPRKDNAMDIDDVISSKRCLLQQEYKDRQFGPLFGSLPEELREKIVADIPIISRADCHKSMEVMGILWKRLLGQDVFVFDKLEIGKCARWIDSNHLALNVLEASEAYIPVLIPLLNWIDLRGCLSFPMNLLGTCVRVQILILEGLLFKNNELQGIENLRSLTYLNLAYTNLSNDTIRFLKHSTLQHLNLSRCRYIEDNGVMLLSQLSSLKILNLSACPISGTSLHTLTSLTSLDVSYCSMFSHEGVKSLATLKSMTHLDLNNYRGKDEDGKWLALLTNLKKLIISKAIKSRGMQKLSKLTSLQTFSVFSQGLEDDGYEALGKMFHLSSLKITQGYLSNEKLRSLTPLTGLQKLELKDCKEISKQGFAEIAKLRTLMDLSLLHCELSSKKCAELGNALTNLRRLNLSYSLNLTDKGLFHLAKLSKLTTFSLRMTVNDFTAKGYSYIENLTNLISLDLGWELNLNEEGVKSLEKLTGLTTLCLEGTLLDQSKITELKHKLGILLRHEHQKASNSL